MPPIALATGGPIGPLHGVPVTIKDHEAVRGMQIEYGTHLRRGDVAAADNAMVSRLRRAGAIILGKTTTPEFGWMGVSNSPLTGITHNPWKLGLNAGASSAGAGVGAAAGYGPLHQGSDGAGSIRMPAHFCGVYGLKPSYGRVPQSPLAASDYTVHLGPLTRTVADAALMLKTMAGPHPDDHTSLEAQPADYPRHLGHRPRAPRIAYSPDLDHARVDPEVAELVAKAVAAFESDLGWRVEPVKTPWGPKGPELARFFWPAHFSRHADRLPEFRDRMDPGFVACIEAGLHITMAGLPEDAAGQIRLLRRDQSLLRGLGFPADAFGVRRGVSGGAAAAASLAAASVGLAQLGGVLLPLQPVAESGSVDSLRLHQGRPAGRPADRRASTTRGLEFPPLQGGSLWTQRPPPKFWA